LGIFVDQVRDASYRVSQIIVTPNDTDAKQALYSNVVSPVLRIFLANINHLFSEVYWVDTLLCSWLFIRSNNTEIQWKKL
jgi:hypothetical protein